MGQCELIDNARCQRIPHRQNKIVLSFVLSFMSTMNVSFDSDNVKPCFTPSEYVKLRKGICPFPVAFATSSFAMLTLTRDMEYRHSIFQGFALIDGVTSFRIGRATDNPPRTSIVVNFADGTYHTYQFLDNGTIRCVGNNGVIWSK